MRLFFRIGLVWGAALGVLTASSFLISNDVLKNLNFLEKGLLAGGIVLFFAIQQGVLGILIGAFSRWTQSNGAPFLHKVFLWLMHGTGGALLFCFGLSWFNEQKYLTPGLCVLVFMFSILSFSTYFRTKKLSWKWPVNSVLDTWGSLSLSFFVAIFFVASWVGNDVTAHLSSPLKRPSLENGQFPQVLHRSKGSIFLIGLDGADWAIVDPLLKAGKLPNFERLIQNGVRTPLITLTPTVSPAIWTSIATGKSPKKHGISNWALLKIPGIQPIPKGITELTFPKGVGLRSFFKRLERWGVIKVVPFGNANRRVKAFWNILSEAGYEVGLVGWLCTWPVEPISGFMISPYAFPFEFINMQPRATLAKRTYPDPLMKTLEKDLMSREEIAKKAHHEISIPVEMLPEKFFPWNFAKDETFFRMSLHLLHEDSTPDLFGIYFQGIDSSSHQWWSFRSDASNTSPTQENVLESLKTAPSQELQLLLGSFLDRYYLYMDRVIGKILEFSSEDDIVMVVSDHGFQLDGTMHTHAPEGILILSGARIQPHSRFEQPPTVLDITPTLLWAMGLPVGEDMDGRPLMEVFQQSSAGFRLSKIPTYEDKPFTILSPDGGDVDEGLKKNLRSLGYLN